MNKPRVCWKKEPRLKGLARIGQGIRGSILTCKQKEIANVYFSKFSLVGYYWVVSLLVNGRHIYKNTCNCPCKTEEEAKKQVMEFLKEYLTEIKGIYTEEIK